MRDVTHVVVIGAGIIGLAAAHHLRREGFAVTLIDRDPEGDRASHGNAGVIAVTEIVPASGPGVAWRVPGWLLDPLGPLALRPAHAPRLIPWLIRFVRAGRPREVARIAAALAALNARTYDDLLPMLAASGLAGELRRTGSLTVYESEAGFARDRPEWDLRRHHGIAFEAMGGDEARALEPALGPRVVRAVFAPQSAHVGDPRRIVEGLRAALLREGAAMIAGEVAELGVQDARALRVGLTDGRRIVPDRVVVAAGAWSGLLARRLGDPVLLESERGYNTTFPDPGLALGREIVFAERKFVATPLACGLRVGGAAEFGGLGAPPDFRRARALATLARLYLPGLPEGGGTAWAGHRPATPDSLPVIGPSARDRRIVYAFGHGHLGLTQAATTGRLVADLLCERPAPIDLRPYAVERFR